MVARRKLPRHCGMDAAIDVPNPNHARPFEGRVVGEAL
jgi:hypothetical protein